jgi:hypothetical protein
MTTNDQDPASPFYRCRGCGISTTSESELCNACAPKYARHAARQRFGSDAPPERTPISFAATNAETKLIALAIDRFEALEMLPNGYDRMHMLMDLTAANANGCPLDFAKLLQFADSDFLHDVYGIHQHIDRTTGQLGDGFLPRCARPEPLPPHMLN